MNISRKNRKKDSYKIYVCLTTHTPSNLSTLMNVDFCRKRHRVFRDALKKNRLPF